MLIALRDLSVYARTLLAVGLLAFGGGWVGGSLRVQMAVLIDRAAHLEALLAERTDHAARSGASDPGGDLARSIAALSGSMAPSGAAGLAPTRPGHCVSMLLSGPASSAAPRPCPGEDHRIIVSGDTVLCVCQGTEVEIK